MKYLIRYTIWAVIAAIWLLILIIIYGITNGCIIIWHCHARYTVSWKSIAIPDYETEYLEHLNYVDGSDDTMLKTYGRLLKILE